MSLIHILSSTDRPNSNALKVSGYVENYLAEKAETKIFSLMDYPFEDVVGGKYGQTPDSVKEFNEEFLKADGFLFVIPEYNGGFPGVLKLFFDYLPFPDAMEMVPVSLIGEAAGAFGALRPVEQFEQLLKYRKAYIYPERMFIQRVNDTFDPDEGLNNDVLQKLLLSQLDSFPDFVERINSLGLSVDA
ncbi:NADPH-dependent FMN reductase [Rhodohalobacter barkolensis]|uniref:NADPH-dependent oxidoreductase n=1 Tax=Rhodohalobacter barkolensis TaxID=2053187 RepID=A0A2N0VFR0_9BACT|nr:NAD(P)H-dependent oxidoreductase [Rhodohalobacter barkolensis]PKD43000.1 NADPH-dependent oxidoreductase [Rhodohalobacter barkolensis]